MAGRGLSYTFHGAFKSKRKARAKEQSMSGALVKRIHLRQGDGRWLVLKPIRKSRARRRRR